MTAQHAPRSAVQDSASAIDHTASRMAQSTNPGSTHASNAMQATVMKRSRQVPNVARTSCLNTPGAGGGCITAFPGSTATSLKAPPPWS